MQTKQKFSILVLILTACASNTTHAMLRSLNSRISTNLIIKNSRFFSQTEEMRLNLLRLQIKRTEQADDNRAREAARMTAQISDIKEQARHDQAKMQEQQEAMLIHQEAILLRMEQMREEMKALTGTVKYFKALSEGMGIFIDVNGEIVKKNLQIEPPLTEKPKKD